MKSPVLYLALIALFAFSLSSCAEKGTASTKAGKAGGALYGSDAVAPPVKTQEEEPVDNSPQTMVALETEYGTMKIRLYNNTPQHRDNFIKLANEGFFNDLLFHRVIKGFMIQGGDPESKGADENARLGSGGPGYTVPAEINKTNWHIKGSLSAARQGDQVNPQRNSSGSQFYVVQGQGPMPESQMQGFKTRNPYSEQTLADYMAVGGTPGLDGQYTVFGMVVEGLDIIDKIADVETAPGDRPVKDVKMKMTVLDEKYTPGE